MKIKIVIMVIFMCCLVCSNVFSADWNIEQITNNDYSDYFAYGGYNPQKNQMNSNGQAVWVGTPNGISTVFFYNGSSVEQITTNANTKDYVQINSNGDLAWKEEWVEGGHMAYSAAYLRQNSLTSQIIGKSTNVNCLTLNDQGKLAGKISGNVGIFLYDGTNVNIISNSSNVGSWPSISPNGKVVWVGNDDGGGRDVYVYNGTSTVQISTPTYPQWPQINSNGHITWDSAGAGTYFYNGDSEAWVNQGQFAQLSENDKIISNGNNAVYFYDGSSAIQLSSVGYIANNGKIDNEGNAIWQQYDGHDWEIFTYINGITQQITNNEYDDTSPLINGNTIFWSGYDGHDSEIFRATLVLEPAPILVSSNGTVVIDFGPQYGIWIYDNGTWSQLHSISPDSMVAAHIDTDEQNIEDLVIDFGSQYGIWIYYNNSNWVQLHSISPESITVADLDNNGQDDLIIDFGSQYGVWIYYNNSTWSQLHNISPDTITKAQLDSDPRSDLVIDFGSQHGVWVYYNNSTWQQLHSVSPKSITAADMDDNGQDELIVDFGTQYGIWVYYNNSTWSQLHTISAKSITVGSLSPDPKKDLIVDFGPQYGVWVYADNSIWSQGSPISTDSITTGDMNGNGLDEVIVDFGPEYGIWVRNDDGSWWQLHNVSP